jgi:hypothetical protein
VVLNIIPACGLQEIRSRSMPTFVVNGVSYTVTTTQKESAAEKYAKMDNHGILGMVKMVDEGTMLNPEKIAALAEECIKRGLAVQEA